MGRSPEELAEIAKRVSFLIDAAKTLALCEEDEMDVDAAIEDLYAAKNDLYAVIGGCDDLQEEYEPEDWLDYWPTAIEVSNEAGDIVVVPLSEYEEALWAKYKDKLEPLNPQQITLLIDGSDKKIVLPGFLVYGEHPDPEQLPEDFYCYAVRSDDDWGKPASIAESVMVNRLGWFITPIEKKQEGEVDILDWNYID